jgi:hypothetical protein
MAGSSFHYDNQNDIELQRVESLAEGKVMRDVVQNVHKSYHMACIAVLHQQISHQ